MEQSYISPREIIIRFDLKERVIHQLILRSGFEQSLGLLQGKMGIVIFFFHYSKYSKESIYTEIAESLLDKIWEEITVSTPIDFANGLTGVGWGIEYLIQNGFVEGDSNEVCAEIDRMIVESLCVNDSDDLPQKNKDDILFYIMARIKGSPNQILPTIFHNTFLEKLSNLSIKNVKSKRSKNEDITSQFRDYFINKNRISYALDLYRFIDPEIKISERKLFDTPIGLKNGLAGWYLNQLNVSL